MLVCSLKRVVAAEKKKKKGSNVGVMCKFSLTHAKIVCVPKYWYMQVQISIYAASTCMSHRSTLELKLGWYISPNSWENDKISRFYTLHQK